MGAIPKNWCFHFSLLLLFLFQKIRFFDASDTISLGESLSGNQTLTSEREIFELGFFTPGDSQNYYIGIWYKVVPTPKTVVWVANREKPVSDPFSSELKLLDSGNLVLLNETGNQIWSSNSASNELNSTSAKLLDNGNLVVGRNNSLGLPDLVVIWESFNFPTDHWLPGGKVGYDKFRKLKLVSWRSYENPASSMFSFEPGNGGNGGTGYLLWNRSKEYWTTGRWTGEIFTGTPEIKSNDYVKNFTYIPSGNDSYLTYDSAIPNALTRFQLDVSGQFRQFVWQRGFGQWSPLWLAPSQQCEVYGFCGGFSICNQQRQPICACMEGFEPKKRKSWGLGDHMDGCSRNVPLQLDIGGSDNKERDWFFVMANMRFFVDELENLEVRTIRECETTCLDDRSCNGFAYNGENECLVWKGDIFNVQQLGLDDSTGRDLHVRIAASEWNNRSTADTKGKNTTLIILASLLGSSAILVVVLVIMWMRRRSSGWFMVMEENSLIMFKYRDLRFATKNFSIKLGEGGFGSVFKGIVPNSTPIAVKELKNMKGSDKQFLAEVKTIGIIQHINLVHLRGICADGPKKFLVYEYMPNGSLESYLFKKSDKILDWQSRFRIAIGTAKGLAYLHEECEDCIIHCDIKPENILLDNEYNPKVADFGLAKILGRDFSRVLTTIRGTLGYLAPEWFSGEPITHKTDVFSYGMMLLEIISGRRNRDLSENGFQDYFPLRAATAVQNGENVLELLDDRLEGNVAIESLFEHVRFLVGAFKIRRKIDRL